MIKFQAAFSEQMTRTMSYFVGKYGHIIALLEAFMLFDFTGIMD